MVVVQFIILLLTTLLEMNMVKKKTCQEQRLCITRLFQGLIYFSSLCTRTITLNLKNILISNLLWVIRPKLSRKNSKMQIKLDHPEICSAVYTDENSISIVTLSPGFLCDFSVC